MKTLDTLIDRNKSFAQDFDGADLPMLPKLSTMVLSCIDARVDPAHFLGLHAGEALVFRNAGGRITGEVIQELKVLWAMATQMAGGQTPEISLVLVRHGNCGMEKLASPEVRQKLGEATGVSKEALTEMAITRHPVNMAEDVERLRRSASGLANLMVSGYFYDVRTGLMECLMEPARLGDQTPLENVS